jgi:hypothetical protein
LATVSASRVEGAKGVLRMPAADSLEEMTEIRTATLSIVDRTLVALSVVALLFTAYASLRSTVPDLLHLPEQDKIGHAAAYFCVFLPSLFALVWRPGRGDGVLANRQLGLAAALLSVGVLMEVLQALFAPARSPEFLDVVADGVGLCGALLVLGLARWTWPTPSRDERATPALNRG